MIDNEEHKRARLAAFYANFDDFKCRGLCQKFCSKVNFSPVEWELLSDKRIDKPRTARESEVIMKRRSDQINWLGGEIDRKDDCEYLSPIGTCEIYSERPFNCRVFGAVAHPTMICKWGCEPVMSVNNFTSLINQFADVMVDASFFLETSPLLITKPTKYY